MVGDIRKVRRGITLSIICVTMFSGANVVVCLTSSIENKRGEGRLSLLQQCHTTGEGGGLPTVLSARGFLEVLGIVAVQVGADVVNEEVEGKVSS